MIARPADCLSDLALDRLLAGEPAPTWHHVAGCTRCRARLEELRRGARVSDELVARGVARVRRRLWSRRIGVATTLAAAAVLLFSVGRIAPSGGWVERIKGGSLSLGVYV